MHNIFSILLTWKEVIWVLFVHKHRRERCHYDVLPCNFRWHRIEKSMRLKFFSHIRIHFLKRRKSEIKHSDDPNIQQNMIHIRWNMNDW